MANVIQWNGVSYNGEAYPGWAEFLGWVMALASMLLIPAFAIHQLWKTPGTLSEVLLSSFVFSLSFVHLKTIAKKSHLYIIHILLLGKQLTYQCRSNTLTPDIQLLLTKPTYTCKLEEKIARSNDKLSIYNKNETNFCHYSIVNKTL